MMNVSRTRERERTRRKRRKEKETTGVRAGGGGGRGKQPRVKFSGVNSTRPLRLSARVNYHRILEPGFPAN